LLDPDSHRTQIESRFIRAERIFSSEWGPEKRLPPKASEETSERPFKLTRKEKELNWESVLNHEEDFKDWAKYCPSTFSCVNVNAKAQDAFLIPINNHLTKAIWDKELFLTQLVIEEEKRELLKSLVENRLNGHLQSMGDLVSNKGKGIIVVLHGPPGTGKTLVAESIAEFVKRPLKYVSVGEIIANPKTIETTLKEKFEECAKIHAILLMDEVDVVLEARSIEYFRRNAVVTSKYKAFAWF
jgi:SpoVK/Ycf46/Vps4 family AAA+-type ATPase